jgi:hypothetical protein
MSRLVGVKVTIDLSPYDLTRYDFGCEKMKAEIVVVLSYHLSDI